jgi:hypothetical protein
MGKRWKLGRVSAWIFSAVLISLVLLTACSGDEAVPADRQQETREPPKTERAGDNSTTSTPVPNQGERTPSPAATRSDVARTNAEKPGHPGELPPSTGAPGQDQGWRDAGDGTR